MGRMLAEQDSGVNGCEQRRFGRAGGVRRYRTEAWAENRTWSSGRNRGHCRCGSSKVTRGVGRLACLRRVCYKFVAEFWLTTKCLSSIFLLAKLTASSCITVQVWAEKPPTCSGFTTTPDRTRRAKWCLWRRRRTARFFLTSCHWIWEQCADLRRVFIYIPCPDRFSMRPAAS